MNLKTRPGESWLAATISKRLNGDKLSFIALLQGPPGSGKSWAALRIGELVDSAFDVGRVCLDASSFLDLVNEDLPGGSVIILDEAGVAVPARRWASWLNQALGFVAETFRYRNWALLMTTPDERFMDAIPRRLLTMSIEMVRVNREEDQSLGRPYWQQTNPRVGKTYTRRPIIDGPRYPIRLVGIYFSRPADDLADAYEAKRRAFMDGLYARLRDQAHRIDAPETTTQDRVDAVVAEIRDLEDAAHLLNTRGDFDRVLLRHDYGLSHREAATVARLLGRDGKAFEASRLP